MTDPSSAEVVAVRVDDTVCIGAGACELVAPDVFEVSDDGLARVLAPGRLERSAALEAVDRCPSGAISIVDR